MVQAHERPTYGEEDPSSPVVCQQYNCCGGLNTVIVNVANKNMNSLDTYRVIMAKKS